MAAGTTQSTGDPAEIQRFNNLARMWWDPQGPMWPLHLMNRFRIDQIMQVLAQQGRIDINQEQPLEGLDVLDIGCGGGILSEHLARLGARVTAIDLAEHNIRIARDHAHANGLDIDYRVQDVTTLIQSFDLIFNMEVVEHVADLPAFMRACYQCLKPDGITFVSTLNRTLLSFLFAILGAEYILRLLPRGTHQWRKFVTPSELEQLLADSRVNIFWRSGIRFNPWRRTFRPQGSLAVNYILAARKSA